MDRHLVAVEVRVVCMADEGMKLDGLAFHENRFEGLDAKPVQGRCTVEEHRMLLHDFVEHREDFGSFRFHEHLGFLDIVDHVLLDKFFHYKRLEKLERHLRGKTALPHLEFRTYHDYGASRVIDPFSEKVLPEPSLLSLEHVRERFERAIGCALYDTLLFGIVEQGVDRLLEHAFLVPDDDVRCIERHQALEPVVSVDDAPVQIVEVARGEATAVELHHGAQFRRDDGDDIQDHPLGKIPRSVFALPAVAETFDNFYPLEQSLVRLGTFLDHPGTQFRCQVVQVDLFEQGSDGLGSHSRGKTAAEPVLRLVPLLLGKELHAFKIRVARIDDDIFLVIEYGTERSDGNVEEKAHPARHRPVEPDMGNRRCQFDMTHALATNLEMGDFDTAAVADDTLVPDGFEFAAVAFPLFRRAEDSFAEEAVLFRPEGAVIDGLGFFHLAVAPRPDHVRAGESYHYIVEILYIPHRSPPLRKRPVSG